MRGIKPIIYRISLLWRSVSISVTKMLELLLGMVIGTAVGTYNHDKMEPCLQPFMEELVAMKDRIQARIELIRSQRQPVGAPNGDRR